MAIIKGQNLRMEVGGKCIALATSCTFHVAAQTEDISTKDSEDDWTEYDVVGLSWDAQTDSLVTLDEDTNGQVPSSLLDLIIKKTLVTLKFTKTGGAKNRESQTSELTCSGKAFLTDVNITAANRKASTLSCKFTGTGPLS